LTPPFTGLTSLTDRFVEDLASAGKGRGRAILVVGPEGSGRTRLLSEWRTLAQSECALVVEGHARASDRTPYKPILDVLSAMTRRGGSAGAAARATLARMARIAATQSEDLSMSKLLDESSRLAFYEEVLTAFEASRAALAGDRPLVLLLDDLHFADRSTLNLLSFLVRAIEGKRILVAGSSVDSTRSALESGVHRTAREIAAELEIQTVLPLPPLDEKELAHAAAISLGQSQLPLDFVHSLHHDSQGRPGRLVDLLNHYAASSVLMVEGGRLRIDEKKRSQLTKPGGSQELADARLRGLSEEDRSVLAILSVAPADLTQELAHRLVQAAVGDEDSPILASVASRLQNSVVVGLLRVREPLGEATYEFVTPHVRDLLGRSLDEAVKPRLHEAAATYYEQRLSTRPDLISAAAAHARFGQDLERAVRLGVAAAEHAERLFAFDSAIGAYNTVLELLKKLDSRVEASVLREKLGDVYFRAGDLRRSLTAYNAILAEIEQISAGRDRHRIGLLQYKIGMIRLRRGDHAAALSLFEKARTDLAETGSVEERAWLLDALAKTFLERSEPVRAEVKAREGLTMIGADGPEDLQALFLSTLGAAAFQRADWLAAERHLLEAVEKARHSGRAELVRRALSALAATYWKTGRWNESEAIERECLKESDSSKDLWGLTTSLTNLAIIWCGRGDFTSARPHFERALEIHRRLGSPAGQAAAHMNLGSCDEILGNWEEAENNYRLMLDLLGEDPITKPVVEGKAALGNLIRKKGDITRGERILEEALAQARLIGDRDLLAVVLYPMALGAKDRNDLEESRRQLDDVISEMEASGTKSGLARVLFSSADLALVMKDVMRAERDIQRALEIARSLEDRYDLSRLKVLEARKFHAVNQFEEAERVFEDGIRQLSELGAQFDLGKAYYEWGVRTPERPRAMARLGSAARIFEALGARRDLERTRGVLDRISTRAQIDAVIAPPSRERVIGLYEVGKIVNSTRDLSAVLEDIVDLALKRFNAERGMVLLTDHITGKLAIKVARNLKTGREEEAEAISHGVVERVVKEGKSMVSADARIDPRFAGRDSILAHSIVSFICVPLRVKDRPVGAIYVDHRGAPRLFSESDRAFLEAFADLAAVAIENARLVEELLEARQRLSVENESLKANLSRSWNLDALVGHSEAARKIKLALPRAAAGTGTVLIRGESGTGKNLVARILHALGPRSQGPFVQFNCAALPDSLAESELFGHEKGSFTGADRRKPGRFELAQGGSIFLDEIGKATLAIQAKLLRVVEDKEFERVGGTLTLKTDAKILTATNLDLELAIQRNEFREDLFYRLNVVPIEIPPLRKRKEDLPGLISHFLNKLCRDLGTDPRRLDPNVLELFTRYPWPGNIRELEATLHRALVLTPGDVLSERDFPWIQESPLLGQGTPVPGTGAKDGPAGTSANNKGLFVDLEKPLDAGGYEEILNSVEKELIERALTESKGKIRDAARRIGLARNTLKSKMAKYGLRGQDEEKG
jgi:Nif-specific regulatory protein